MDVNQKSAVSVSLARNDEFLTLLQAFLDKNIFGRWCVAAIDIEHFKLFNEWYGTARGDALLSSFSLCLNEIHERDGMPIGYFGNDDFFICLPDDEATIRSVYDKLQSCISVQTGAGNVTFFVVMGVCPVDEGLNSARSLCNYAQIAAMSRSYGSSYICRFAPNMLERLRRQQQLLSEVEEGLASHQFCFFLQPKCNSMTHRIIGMEALVRWNHPTRGYVSPGEFIPLLEHSGQITQLDMYIWEQVCQTLRRWCDENRHIVPISVNVSMADISSLNIAKVFSDLIEKYQLEPRLISIEITESMMAQNIELVQSTILELHRKGFKVLMDDFGSGYSSLNMLKDTSVDVIKLDMKFVDLTPQNVEKGTQIIESVVDMAHRLSMPVIVEGVESQEQVFMLQSMDCLYIQGYYFYKPMPVSDAEALLSGRPESESTWDLQRDMTLRSHRVLGGAHVSERTAISLQAYQIIDDNVAELSRLNLLTGDYRIVTRSLKLPGSGVDKIKTLAEYRDCILASANIDAATAERIKDNFNLDELRSKLFATQKPVSARFAFSKDDGTPSQYIAAVLPCRGCSEKNPWAAVTVMELPEV